MLLCIWLGKFFLKVIKIIKIKVWDLSGQKWFTELETTSNSQKDFSLTFYRKITPLIIVNFNWENNQIVPNDFKQNGIAHVF